MDFHCDELIWWKLQASVLSVRDLFRLVADPSIKSEDDIKNLLNERYFFVTLVIIFILLIWT